jgi:hypothetical protein
VAAAPAAYAAVETARRATAETLPRADQRRLPLDESLASLCPVPGAPADPALAGLRARARALVAEIGRRPDHLVSSASYRSDAPPVRRSVTVRELGREQLRELERVGGCDIPERRALRAALDER